MDKGDLLKNKVRFFLWQGIPTSVSGWYWNIFECSDNAGDDAMWGRLWMCQQCSSLCCAHGHKHQSWWSRSVWSCICHIHYPGKKPHCLHIHVQLSNKHSSKTYCNVLSIRKRLCTQTHQLIQKMSNARLIDCSSKMCIISLPPLLGRVHPMSFI